MRIFRQNEHFLKVLIIWRARVQTLVLSGPIQKITGILKI